MSGPTISAIMPTYNQAPYLREAIDSVLAQTFTDWELIIVDDGSTDETPAILASYTDPRIRRFRLPVNQGRGVARNMAVERTKGRYIAICDSDDITFPRRFEREVAFLESHPEVDVVSAQVAYFWGEDLPQVRIIYPERPADIRARFDNGKMAVSHAASMIRRRCFEEFGLYCGDCRRAQDLEFFLRLNATSTFASLPEVLVLYRHQVTGYRLQKWIENAYYTRYAVYRATRLSGEETLRFAPYSRQWQVRLSVWTVDLLRLLNYTVKSLLPVPHVLR